MFPLSASPPELLWIFHRLALRPSLHSQTCGLAHGLPASHTSSAVRMSIRASSSVHAPLRLCARLLTSKQKRNPYSSSLRKEVIQPHLPIRLPCYDFTPVIRPAFGSSLLAVGSLTSGISDSHGVTGGVYKTRERIHRSMLICDY